MVSSGCGDNLHAVRIIRDFASSEEFSDVLLELDLITEAIASYQQALEVYTRTTFPEQWAMRISKEQFNVLNSSSFCIISIFQTGIVFYHTYLNIFF